MQLCDCHATHFQSFATNSAFILGTFWECFFAYFSTKYVQILPKFSQKIVFQPRKTMFKQCFKNLNFYGNGMVQSLHFWCSFDPIINLLKVAKIKNIYIFKEKRYVQIISSPLSWKKMISTTNNITYSEQIYKPFE